mmetsp:Transcript_10589/g.24102  ORF Transcript_10589/g.24102 Transcript_10589/m.24102 type:complete len:83 (-) Transcript_10589:513-761(-)
MVSGKPETTVQQGFVHLHLHRPRCALLQVQCQRQQVWCLLHCLPGCDGYAAAMESQRSLLGPLAWSEALAWDCLLCPGTQQL